MITYKNLHFPFFLENQLTIYWLNHLPLPISRVSGNKNWRTIKNYIYSNTGGVTRPTRDCRISLLCSGVPARTVMAIRSTAQGGTGIQKTFRLFTLTLTSATGDTVVCWSSEFLYNFNPQRHSHIKFMYALQSRHI